MTSENSTKHRSGSGMSGIKRRSFLKVTLAAILAAAGIKLGSNSARPAFAGNCTSVRCFNDYAYACDAHGCVYRYDALYCYDFFDNTLCYIQILGNCLITNILC